MGPREFQPGEGGAVDDLCRHSHSCGEQQCYSTENFHVDELDR